MDKFNIYTFLKSRPLSWSAISSFEYDPEQWYKRYIRGEKTPETPEMLFGKKVADSFQTKCPLAPVVLYPVVEQKLSVVLNKNIPLLGFIDTYNPKGHHFREFKTSKTLWGKKKAQAHGQLKMYALMIFITHKARPEDYTIHLDCVQTESKGDFTVDFVKPFKIESYEVKLTMKDVLEFAGYIAETVKKMEEYVNGKHL